MKTALFILLAACLIFSCKKDTQTLPHVSDPPISDEFVFSSCSLLKEPSQGWFDTTLNSEKYLWRVLYSPMNSQEILYVGNFKLYNYNTLTKKTNLIFSDVIGMPSINKQGWITFSDHSSRIYTVKTNGDSLNALDVFAFSPLWDYSGQHVIFFDEQVYRKMDKDGSNIDTLKNCPTIFTYFKNSNKIISSRDGKIFFIKDMATGEEKLIFTQANFTYHFHMTIDNKDENIYWWGDEGVISCNLSSLKIDTLVKACPPAYPPAEPANPNSNLGATNISYNSDKLTMVYYLYVPYTNSKRVTNTYALQMDLKTHKITEIKLFE